MNGTDAALQCSGDGASSEPFDLSQIPYPMNTTGELDLSTGSYVKILVYIVNILAAVFGNMVVILVVIFNVKMRTTINYYLVNVAVADILITLCCTWVHLVNHLSTQFILGAFMCRINGFAQSK